MTKRTSVKVRINTHRMVLQALYQWHVSRQHTANIDNQFREEHATKSRVDWDEFSRLLVGVVSMSDALDKGLEPLMDRKICDLDPVELSILRLGSYELRERLDIPHAVILDKSVKLAHAFGANESYKFINAVLDKLCSQLPVRKTEKDTHQK